MVAKHLPICVILLATLTGCFGKPNQANIQLRKEKQQLQDRIAELERLNAGAKADIDRLSRDNSVQTLPRERLEKLFTTHSISLGRLTGGTDLDSSKPGDEALKVVLTPLDQSGEKLKAAGSIKVEAFDLSASTPVRIGEWNVSVEDAVKSWNGYLGQYGYSLTLPWQTVPSRNEFTIKVTFTDELTGRSFTAQQVVKVSPPASTSAAGKKGS